MGEIRRDELSDRGSIPLRSTIPCFNEHLSIKVFKTRIKLESGAAKIVPCLKTKKEMAVLEAFKAIGFIANTEE